MLDANLKTQLKSYLEKVSRPIEIVASLDNSPKSVELQGLLHEIATLSDRIAVIEKRDGRGTNIAKKLRKTGRIPAVIYGHKEATISVSLSFDEVQAVLRHKAQIVDLKIDGSMQKAQIREVQWDHLGKEVQIVEVLHG